MHALLFRKWKNRVKGRDWYDLEWYIKKGIPLSLHHFLLRAKNSGHWREYDITEEQVLQLLTERIEAVSFDNIREDIVRFIPDAAVLDIWSKSYFMDLIAKLKFSA
jgi:hypothetical protein